MSKDREQLTPAEVKDRDKIHRGRSAARDANGPDDPSSSPGPASSGVDPDAIEELQDEERDRYR